MDTAGLVADAHSFAANAFSSAWVNNLLAELAKVSRLTNASGSVVLDGERVRGLVGWLWSALAVECTLLVAFAADLWHLTEIARVAGLALTGELVHAIDACAVVVARVLGWTVVDVDLAVVAFESFGADAQRSGWQVLALGVRVDGSAQLINS